MYCICVEDGLLLLDYLQQQCELKILKVEYFKREDTAKFQEFVKCHKKLEVVSIWSGAYDNDFIQCLSELMYRPCFQQLTIKNYLPFNDVHSLLSAFFLSPYPVTLRLNEVCLRMDSNDPIPVPLATNNEQQSKSLNVALSGHLRSISSRILESNFLPQYIVLKSLKIRSNDALYLFSIVKSIKVDEITIDIDTDTDTNSLRSLLSIVSANDMTVSINEGDIRQSILALEIIFNSLFPTKPPYLQLIVKLYSEDDPSPILYDTWKRCGAIKLKKAVVVDEWDQEKNLKDFT